jgi:histidyl-tRNA synthetase
VLNGVLQQAGLAEHSVAILRALDKLPKIGLEKTQQEMLATTPASTGQLQPILQLAGIGGDSSQVLRQLEDLCRGNSLAEEGLQQLTQIVQSLGSLGITSQHLQLDVAIARGLDYYTGTIYETFLDDLPAIGSVCSGGRYDHLAQLFTKQELPGIGASLGLDRLLAAMQELQMIPAEKTTAHALIIHFGEAFLNDYLKLAADLRSQGLGIAIYPDAKKLDQQFKYADRNGFKAVIVAGSEEWQAGKIKIKWLASGQQIEIARTSSAVEIAEALRETRP